MTDNEIKAYILEVGYKTSREDKWFNIEKINKDLGEEGKRVENLAAFMEKKGLIRVMTMDGDWEITEQGIYQYERTHEEK